MSSLGNNMAIWRDTAVEITHRFCRVRKISGNKMKIYTGLGTDNGDIPMGSLNTITNKFEPCDNKRGLAYAHRKDVKYRKKK